MSSPRAGVPRPPPAGTLLIRDISHLATQNDSLGEITDAAIFIRGNVIEFVGKTSDLPAAVIESADHVINGKGHVFLPGLVNTHAHMFQALNRCMAQDQKLHGWLRTLYPVWSRHTGASVFTSTLVSIAELLLSGCTTSSDHLYMYPNDVKLEDTIRAARAVGLRFHPVRGGMSAGVSRGGIAPDSAVEEEADILADMERCIGEFHDNSKPTHPQAVHAAHVSGPRFPEDGHQRPHGVSRQAGQAAPGGQAAHTPSREPGGHRVHGATVRLPLRVVHQGRGVGQVRLLVRALRHAQRVGARPLRGARHRHCPLPILQYSPGVGHRTRQGHAGSGCQRGPRGGRGLQLRRAEPASGGQAGGAAAAGGGRPAGSGRQGGAAYGHPRRRHQPGAPGRAGPGGTRLRGRHRGLQGGGQPGLCRHELRPGRRAPVVRSRSRPRQLVRHRRPRGGSGGGAAGGGWRPVVQGGRGRAAGGGGDGCGRGDAFRHGGAAEGGGRTRSVAGGGGRGGGAGPEVAQRGGGGGRAAGVCWCSDTPGKHVSKNITLSV